MTVHNIDMNDGTAAGGGSTDLVRQMGEIGRQNRGCEFNQPGLSREQICEEILTRGGHAQARTPTAEIGAWARRRLGNAALTSPRSGTYRNGCGTSLGRDVVRIPCSSITPAGNCRNLFARRKFV